MKNIFCNLIWYFPFLQKQFLTFLFCHLFSKQMWMGSDTITYYAHQNFCGLNFVLHAFPLRIIQSKCKVSLHFKPIFGRLNEIAYSSTGLEIFDFPRHNTWLRNIQNREVKPRHKIIIILLFVTIILVPCHMPCFEYIRLQNSCWQCSHVLHNNFQSLTYHVQDGGPITSCHTAY